MNRKEVREIKKRFEPEMENFNHVYGCYVNAAKEIVSEIDIQTITLSKDEKEMYVNILKKTLSGSLGRNLVDLEFATEQVGNSDEHTLLQALRMSHCNDENMRKMLYERIIESINMEEKSFVILMVADTYDVPYKVGADEEWDEDSTDQFDYFVCCICPVKDSKQALRYFGDDKNFHEASTGSLLQAPQLGFMFPAFDGRATNIYNALYYTKSSSEMHEEVIQAVFNVPRIPMAAAMQKDAFSGALGEALGEELSLDVVKSVTTQISNKIEEHKASKEQGLPQIDIDDVNSMLMKSGVSDEKISEFNDTCRRYFDNETVLNPSNLIETKKFEVQTPEAKVTVAPDNIGAVKTQVIDGTEYLLIPIRGGVIVNGIEVTNGDELSGVGESTEYDYDEQPF